MVQEERAERAELREVEALNRLEQAEMRIEDLEKELLQKEHKEVALMEQIESFTEELQSKEKTLNAQQAALRRILKANSTKEHYIRYI